jgi:tetratricopeptide (TPR) repeat protein
VFLLLVLVSVYDTFSNRYYIRNNMPHEMGFGISKFPFPVNSADFVKENKPARELYNNFESGGFLMWALYPDYRVFIDGRYIDPVFDKVHLTTVLDFNRWQEMAEQYRINVVLLKFPASDTSALIQNMLNSESWKMVFLGSNSMVLVKASGSNKNIIEHHGLSLPPYEERLYARNNEIPFQEESYSVQAYQRLYAHPVDRALQNLQRLIENIQKPPIPMETLNRAYFLHLAGFLTASAQEYTNVIKSNLDYLPAHYELGLISLQLGNFEAALHEMKFMIAKGSANFETLFCAGLASFRLGNFEAAIQYLSRAHDINNKDFNTCFYLSLSHVKLGDLDDAERYMREALSINPDSVNARRNLDSIQLLKQKSSASSVTK